jgi:hypothetical protein
MWKKLCAKIAFILSLLQICTPHISIGYRLFTEEILSTICFLIFNRPFGFLQALLDIESPEDVDIDPGDLEGGSAKVLDMEYDILYNC